MTAVAPSSTNRLAQAVALGPRAIRQLADAPRMELLPAPAAVVGEVGGVGPQDSEGFLDSQRLDEPVHGMDPRRLARQDGPTDQEERRGELQFPQDRRRVMVSVGEAVIKGDDAGIRRQDAAIGA